MLTPAEAELLKLAVLDLIEASCRHVVTTNPVVTMSNLQEKRSVFRVLLENITEKP